MDIDLKAQAGSFVRLILGLVAGLLVTKGLLKEGQQTGWVEGATGAVFFVGSFAWAIFKNLRARKAEKEKIAVAIQSPATTTVAQVEEKHEEMKTAGAFKGPEPQIQV